MMHSFVHLFQTQILCTAMTLVPLGTAPACIH